MNNTLEEKAEAYAERIVRHDIDSIRYAMKDPFACAKADFTAGYEAAKEDFVKAYELMKSEDDSSK